MNAETVEVPFVVVGNRRGLTAKQVQECEYLGRFLLRHWASFEHDLNRDVYLLVEEG